MRLNLTKQELGDFIIMLLFDKAFDEEFLMNNENFQEFMERLRSKGLQSIAFDAFFDVDPQLRAMYKKWRNSYDNEGRRVAIELFPEPKNESIESNEDLYRELIAETVKKVVGKEDPNPDKLRNLQDEILYGMLGEQDE